MCNSLQANINNAKQNINQYSEMSNRNNYEIVPNQNVTLTFAFAFAYLETFIEMFFNEKVDIFYKLSPKTSQQYWILRQPRALKKRKKKKEKKD